jgi:EpsD family peptidyl-prolyl cis-trans isomerase
MIKLKSSLTLPFVACMLTLGLTACGNKDEKKVASQVAAKVGTEEISVHQINQVLSRTNTTGVTPQAARAMSREVLEKLIDQQLAVNQATENKLNRSPEVVAQIESTRREILARAYMQQIVAGLPKPAPEDVKKYYVEHPQLFGERRIFNVTEIVAPITPGVAEQLRGLASSGKSIEEAGAWLKSKDIKFGGGSATRAAEQIPLELLAQIHTLKDGQSIAIQSAQAITLLRVASSQSSPVTEAAATPKIEQFLTNQRANEAVTLNIKKLRADAKLTYLGEFAKTDGVDTVAAAKPAAPASSAEDKTRSALEQGIAGLK